MRAAAISAAALTHFGDKTTHNATENAKAAQVCPEGKEFISLLVIKGVNCSIITHGRRRPTKGLIVRLVINSPKVIAHKEDAPAFRVLRKHSISTPKAMNSQPPFPN